VATKTPILFLDSRPLPGADTAVHATLLRSLDRSRFEAHAACSAGPRGAGRTTLEIFTHIRGLEVVPVDLGPSFFGLSRAQKVLAAMVGWRALLSFAQLVRHARRHRIRIIHSGEMPRDVVTGALLARATGAKLVVHVHVGYGDWMKPWVRWALARADALIGVSEFVAGSLAANGHDPRKVHAVLNAIDPAAWDPDLDPTPVRRELGIPPSSPVVVTISRLFRWKGHADLLRAVALVRREAPDVRLLVVGGEYPHGSGYMRELETLVTSLGLAGHVVFTGHRADVANILAASDVFAMPSLEEPFGLVYLEAMAMKKPVVALDSGGAPEVVERGETGLLAPPGDIDALARLLLTLIQDPELRSRMGDLGRRRVETRFNPERMARDAEAVFDAIA
jgi:glycosyltransferase involved in cell wall biosynthesis